jgi:superfamily II DNA or RNA helicase
MEVKIDSLAWMRESDIPEVDRFLLKRRLVVVPRVTSRHNQDPRPIILYKETDDGLIGIPRGYFRDNFTAQEIDCTSLGSPLSSDLPAIVPRSEQVDFIQMSVSRLQKELGLILQAPTAFGKTVCCLEVARRLGRRTLIMVHKERLMQQWLIRIKLGDEDNAPFFPGAKVGIVQEDRCEYEGCDFVIAMVQTLVSREMTDRFYNAFGTVVADEVHRLGSYEWGQIIPRFHARYFIGLSATPRRKDGAENVFKYHIGDTLVASGSDKLLKPTIYVKPTGYEIIQTPDFDPSKISKEVFLRIISKSKNRNMMVVSQLVKAARSGRNIMVMCDRIKHVVLLKEMFDAIVQRENLKISSGLYIGAMLEKRGDKEVRVDLTDEELDEASKCQVIFATFKMAEDALDIWRLDTLFLASPIYDPEQAVGRILRKCPICNTEKACKHKKDPLVVDLVDSVNLSESFLKGRLGVYERKGWSVFMKG